MADQSPLMTVAELAEFLSVSESTVKRWASQGLLPAVRIGRGYLRFRREDVKQIYQGKTWRPEEGNEDGYAPD